MAIDKSENKKFFAEIVKSQTNGRLEDLRLYIHGIESKFNRDKSKLEKDYDLAVKNLSSQEVAEIEHYFSEDYYMIHDVHIVTHRKATLVSIYSFLENSLNCLCRHLYETNKYPVELGDIRGEGIVRSRIYLEKLVNIDFTQLNGVWGNLVSLNKIRNCIVHCEGDIKTFKSTTALENIISQDSNLSLQSNRYLIIERGYLDFCISKIEELLDELYSRVL